MEKKIITEPLDIEQSIELTTFMYNRMIDTMTQSGLSIVWYETSSMMDFFEEMPEICDDEGNIVGEGIETSDYKFVLNNKTISDFEEAFWSARKRACEEYKRKHEYNPWPEWLL